MKFSQMYEGQVLEFGSHTVTEQEIIDFATSYDPQPFHIDPVAARATTWDGIIASGFHTCSIAMRLIVDNVLAGSESSGSPGLNSIKWLKPVRPGDTLRMRVEVLQAQPSRTGRSGVVVWQWQLRNQRSELVLDLVGTSLFDLRAHALGE